MVETFRSLLNRKYLSTQCVTYDTTFDMDAFYLSVVTFRHTEFKVTPVIPLLFVIHDQRTGQVHDKVFETLNRILPVIRHADNLLFATDKEAEILNVITKTFPKIPRVRCWIHARRNIKARLLRLGIKTKTALSGLKKDFENLLDSTSLLDYERNKSNAYLKWKGHLVISAPILK